jgi:hypothetical protein
MTCFPSHLNPARVTDAAAALQRAVACAAADFSAQDQIALAV